jgi:hypothetical protein
LSKYGSVRVVERQNSRPDYRHSCRDEAFGVNDIRHAISRSSGHGQMKADHVATA